MPYRWKKTKIENNAIVESRQLDQSYSNLTSVINGGIDRDNLPYNCIDETHCKDNTFGKTVIRNNIANPDETTYQDTNYGFVPSNENPRGNCVAGLTYNRTPVNQGGSPFEITTQSIDCEEGMALIEWRCNTYIPMYWSYYAGFTSTKVALKSCWFEIRVNDVIVYIGPESFEAFKTHVINVAVPISKGNNTVKVYACVRDKLAETNAQVILQYWGGQLTIHNQYR